MAEEECTPSIYSLEDCCTPPVINGGSPIIVEGPPGPPAVSCPLFCGTGSPEGVITSPIGGIYEQTDAGALSHSIWFKHTGVGNTGWRQWAGLRGGSGANTALRIGDNSIASGVNSIAVGENAEATAESAIALGKNTLASGARSEAFGQDSEATAADAKAFGAGALAGGVSAVAIGNGATANGLNAIAHGNAAIAAGAEAVALGDAASAAGAQGLAIGNAANASVAEAIAIGDGAAAAGIKAIAIGDAAVANGLHGIALGAIALAPAEDSISLGQSEAKNRRQVNIGKLNRTATIANAFGEVLIGYNNDGVTYVGGGQRGNEIIIGSENFWATRSGWPGESLILIGQNNDVEAAAVVAIGSAMLSYDTLVGGTALDWASYGVMIGPEVRALADCFVAIGYQAKAYGVGATALGPHTQAGNNVDSLYTTAVGRYASVTGDRSVALGSSAVVAYADAIGLGHGATPSATKKMRIGSAAAPIDEITVMTSTGLKTVTMV